MKIILAGVNAKYIHSNPAIHSLAAYADRELEREGRKGYEIDITEYTINQRKEDIVADLYRKKPDVLAFSCYIWNWTMIGEILPTIHKLYPRLPIWLGGPEVSFTAEEILKEYPFLAGIMTGEGEETFLELCRMYLDGRRELLPGTVTPEGKGESRPLLAMDCLPFFYRDTERFSNRIIYYESSRGCPYRCSYCLSAIEKQLRFRDVETVKEHLLFFLDKKVPQVKFIDRTFNANEEYACRIWEFIRENDNGITNFHFEIAADILNERQLTILSGMRPGLIQLEIGIQTIQPETLEYINRRMDLEKVEKRVRQIAGYKNIHQHLDLIAGLPGEDYEAFRESFNWVYRLQPNQLQLGFLKVLKGSPLWEKAEEYGIVYEDSPPYEVLLTRWIGYEEIRRLKGVEEMLELYYNSGQFTYTLGMLEKQFATPFDLYRKLAEYVAGNGLEAKTSARINRYQILLEFIKGMSIGGEEEEMYRQLLTFDLYLREKMKTRPEFAPELQGVKEEIRRFYRKEEKNRRWLPNYEDYDDRQLQRMTHLEPFQWSVWEKGECRLLEAPVFVLFDYQMRDPLTMAAATRPIIQATGEER